MRFRHRTDCMIFLFLRPEASEMQG